MTRVAFGAWLREQRVAQGLSLRDVCAKTGLKSYPFISQIEAGDKQIPPERVKAYARALAVPTAALTDRMKEVYDQELDDRVRLGDTTRRSGTSATRGVQDAAPGIRCDSSGKSSA